MFFGDRYLTRAIEATLPKSLQLYLWKLIEKLCYDDSINIDYLQVFELIPLENNQIKIIHKQEQPPHEKEYILENVTLETSQKIFVIDSGSYSTMLLAREY